MNYVWRMQRNRYFHFQTMFFLHSSIRVPRSYLGTKNSRKISTSTNGICRIITSYSPSAYDDGEEEDFLRILFRYYTENHLGTLWLVSVMHGDVVYVIK